MILFMFNVYNNWNLLASAQRGVDVALFFPHRFNFTSWCDNDVAISGFILKASRPFINRNQLRPKFTTFRARRAEVAATTPELFTSLIKIARKEWEAWKANPPFWYFDLHFICTLILLWGIFMFLSGVQVEVDALILTWFSQPIDTSQLSRSVLEMNSILNATKNTSSAHYTRLNCMLHFDCYNAEWERCRLVKSDINDQFSLLYCHV